MEYTIDDLYQSVNDVYAQYDDGLDKKVATQVLVQCCKEFIKCAEEPRELKLARSQSLRYSLHTRNENNVYI